MIWKYKWPSKNLTNFKCPVIQKKESFFHKSQVTRNYARYVANIKVIARPLALHIHVACNPCGKFRLVVFPRNVLLGLEITEQKKNNTRVIILQSMILAVYLIPSFALSALVIFELC